MDLTVSHDVVLVLYEDEYVDCKCEYELVNELSIVSHARCIMRYNVAFTFVNQQSCYSRCLWFKHYLQGSF